MQKSKGKIINIRKDYRKNKGFALLFAVLTSSLLIALGLSIFSLSYKELLIAQSARDSQIAYYAADSARECALYWDIKHSAFKTCLSSSCADEGLNSGLSSIKCNGQDIPSVSYLNGSHEYIYSSLSQSFALPKTAFLNFELGDDLAPEADINVSKFFDTVSGNITTTITSNGHNVGPNNRRVERGMTQVY